jgi:excinuclease ABC subunit C
LSVSKIQGKKYKRCLEYHLGNCKGACEGLETAEAYAQNIESIREILKGNFTSILKNFKQRMDYFAAEMFFEEAQKMKDKIQALQSYQSKSTIVSPKISSLDVFSIKSDENAAYINFLQVSHGAIVRSYSTEIKKRLQETDPQLLQHAIVELSARFNLKTKEICVPFPVIYREEVKITVPKAGDKKFLLDLSLRNAKYYRMDKLKQIKIMDPEKHAARIMTQMKVDLRLSHLPVHIECFDNSNIQGTHPVAACVVFKNGKPSKKDYRHFNIKTVKGPDDFASMAEVVFRRYKRLLNEDKPLPQLVVVDGGKGQLSAALKSIDQLGLRGKIALLGIAKRLEELYYPDDPVPLYLDKKSETLKVIQQLRNEAHRFGIEHHRNRRSKTALKSELELIPGVGERTIIELLRHFKSLRMISFAKLDELEDVVGLSRAQKIYNYYNPN